MRLHKMLSLLVAITALLLPSTSAHHVKCSWKPSSKAPAQDGWRRFCTATVTPSTDGTAAYFCDGNFMGYGQRVADWGRLAPKTLEFGTACGGGGYSDGIIFGAECLSKAWQVCVGLGDNPKTQCYGLNGHDDCYWPQLLNQAPEVVDIWLDPRKSPG